MSNRNFDNRVIIQRLQNKNYARSLYQNNVDGNRLITNPQNSDGNASRLQTFVPGAQTEYFRGLLGAGETINLGGIANIPPFTVPSIPVSSNTPSPPTITFITPSNTRLVVNFTPGSSGSSPITDYEYSIDNSSTWNSSGSTTSPIIIDGLTNGVSYPVIIRAINSSGPGANSNTISSIPVSTLVTFSSTGSTTWVAPTNIYSINYLIVAGGGGSGGGFDTGGGGGGGGGMVLTGTESVTPGTSYTVVVGAGGEGGTSVRSPSFETNGSPGENSSFDTLVALGGNGGYASRQTAGVSSAGGNAVALPSTASTGGSGGGSAGDGNGAGGGGGGNTTNGSNGVANTGGNGGNGISSSLSGSSVFYGAGGRGANGNVTAGNTAVAGAANTGNGARGGGTGSLAQTNGAGGGSGLVIIQY